MTFDEILDGATEMLRRRGKVSRRALARQFELDDGYLDDIVEEIVAVQELARQEDGGVLVWLGPDSAAAAERGEVTDPSSDAAVLPAPSVQNHGERRQLTVVFCDLVQFTQLSGVVDAEELRELVRAYHTMCEEVVTGFDGTVAQFLGDGVLVYFGYPRAHEDEAIRAVRAALAIIDEMGRLNARLQEYDVRLRVRIGVHTGLVVVGEMGNEGRKEEMALGEAPNAAARLQGLAEPDTVVVSSATLSLTHSEFETVDLGEHVLKGITAPFHVHRVVGHADSGHREPEGRSPLVGRGPELALLSDRWTLARQGHGQAVLVSGEAGIGKSRLCGALRRRLPEGDVRSLTFRCDRHASNSPLSPVVRHLREILALGPGDARDGALHRIEAFVLRAGGDPADTVPQLAALLDVPLGGAYSSAATRPRERLLTLEMLRRWLLGESEDRPLLLVWEDLHWADASTLELLELILERTSQARVLLLFTARPDFTPPWPLRSNVAQIVLNRFTPEQVRTLITTLAGETALPGAVIEQVIERTDGVPFYIEEVTKLALESAGDSRTPATIPATLRDSLMARLDLQGRARELAQIGATIGREFPYQLIRSVYLGSEEELKEDLRRLTDAELLYERGIFPDCTYAFKHALLQDTAYQSLLKRTRKGYHQRIARALREEFAELVESRPDLLARHSALAGERKAAVSLWTMAGEQAIRRSAHVEAIGHLEQALALLGGLPDAPERAQEELRIQLCLGLAFTTTRGYGTAEAVQAYARARELAQASGAGDELFPALVGLWRSSLLRAQYDQALQLADELLTHAHENGDPDMLRGARRAMGSTLFYLGEFQRSLEYLQAVTAEELSEQEKAGIISPDVADSRSTSYSYASWGLWMVGDHSAAAAASEAAEARASELEHPFTLVLALSFAEWLHQFCGDPERTEEATRTALEVAEEHDFAFWVGWGEVLAGWSQACGGEPEGIHDLVQGLALWKAADSELGLTYFVFLHAEALACDGQIGQALEVLDEAFAFGEETGERFWEAELHRLRGDLLLRLEPPDAVGAEASLRRALKISRHQGARSLEVRAAVALAPLLQKRGEGEAATEMLRAATTHFAPETPWAELDLARQLSGAAAG